MYNALTWKFIQNKQLTQGPSTQGYLGNGLSTSQNNTVIWQLALAHKVVYHQHVIETLTMDVLGSTSAQHSTDWFKEGLWSQR